MKSWLQGWIFHWPSNLILPLQRHFVHSLENDQCTKIWFPLSPRPPKKAMVLNLNRQFLPLTAAMNMLKSVSLLHKSFSTFSIPSWLLKLIPLHNTKWFVQGLTLTLQKICLKPDQGGGYTSLAPINLHKGEAPLLFPMTAVSETSRAQTEILVGLMLKFYIQATIQQYIYQHKL